MSPARPAATSRWESDRAARPAPARPSASRPVPARPPAAVTRSRPRRRSGRFGRFLQVLLSIIILIAAPVVALVFAYSYGTGESLQESATQLLNQLRDLLDTGKA
jgi:hypothetical protein